MLICFSSIEVLLLSCLAPNTQSQCIFMAQASRLRHFLFGWHHYDQQRHSFFENGRVDEDGTVRMRLYTYEQEL